jgi:predicted nucleic acid-binding protein
VIAYFDTSALLKLVIAERDGDQAILLWQEASHVVASRLAWAEAAAALAAARRGRRVSDEGYQTAAEGLRSCFERCTMVSIADSLVDRAADLATGYDLRAADAIHLATALAVMEADSLFVTWDRRLRLAAVQAGLVTSPADSDRNRPL